MSPEKSGQKASAAWARLKGSNKGRVLENQQQHRAKVTS